MGFYKARPYQVECLKALAKARADGISRGLVNMASGLGKTLIAVFDIEQFLQDKPDTRVLVLCHRENILLQTKRKFKKHFGDEYSYGMYTGTEKASRLTDFTFATFQTMKDNRERFASDTFGYIVVDEAHHTPAVTYRPTVDYFSPQFLLGLTATKDRMDGQDILEIYKQVLYSMDIYDGWSQGWLARVDYRIMLDDLREEEFKKYVGPHATDEKVSMLQLNKTIFAPQRDEDIVASIRDQISDLEDPSIFVFCPGIDHANAMAHHFGGEVAVIHSEQSPAFNEAILSDFRCGKIRIIISVNMLNEGIDIPEADVVVFLRATESSTIYFQQLGRGLRTSDNKRMVRVLDFVANIERIAMVLEMEETAKKRIIASPTYSPSANKPDPIVIDVPATKFKVQRVDIEDLLKKLCMCPKCWTDEEIVDTYFEESITVGHWLDTREMDASAALPTFWGVRITERFGGMVGLRQKVRDKYGDRVKSLDEVAAAWSVPDKELAERYWLESQKKGQWLTCSELRQYGNMLSLNVIHKRMGGIVKLRELAEELYGKIGEKSVFDHLKEYTDEELIKEYYTTSKERKHWLSYGDIRSGAFVVSIREVNKRFGSVKELRAKAVKHFGEFPQEKKDRTAKTIRAKYLSFNETLKCFYDESVKVGRWLKSREVLKNENIPNTVIKQAGGYTKLLALAIERFGDFIKGK